MRKVIGRFGSSSDAASLPDVDMTSSAVPSRWRTFFICAAVSPLAPPQVMASAVVMLAGEKMTFPWVLRSRW